MNRFALATAAILVATASAFAGSDHFGSDNANQPAAPVAGWTMPSPVPSTTRLYQGTKLRTPR
ncbi:MULTISPECIES: DUF680 domain-containing protein [unclassified Mesorhizobium]|uniref:DUF680 domain-containing protein n=1 Tax=unclassified Mesorhizobium TaxID=325217 RepID=UPI00296240BA|nr:MULTISPECIES: DUF680 domain-containing protein [unclassified Mesorhizobium]